MSDNDELDMGSFRVVRGGLYGSRPSRGLSAPRHHVPKDPKFSRRVAGVVAAWKRSGVGPYASRAIANTAQHIVCPCSRLDRMMRDAIAADVPLDRVEALGYEFITRARELHAAKRTLKPAA